MNPQNKNPDIKPLMKIFLVVFPELLFTANSFYFLDILMIY